ncbi:MAG TPA: ABC transporter permease [Trebonia sp.]|nr:ABC transporter permease [Trebonia sp.]
MATLTTRTPAAGLSPLPPASGKAGLRGTLASEWTKLRSVRSTYWTLFALIVVGVGLDALASWAFDNSVTQHGRVVGPGFDATRHSLVVFGIFGPLVLMVLGVMTITAEYSTGMIRTSLTTMPRRGVVYGAKLLVFTGIAVVVSLITAFIAFFLGQALMSGTGHAATLSQPNVLRAIIGVALYVVLVALMGYGLGAIIRHTAGAIASVVGLAFVLPLVTQALPQDWINDITRWLPSSAGDAILTTFGSQPNEFSAWGQLAVTAGYAVILLIIGAVLSRKRDA